MLRLFLLIIIYTFSSASLSHGQRISEADALSLEEALSLAYQHNPSLTTARKEQKVQEGRSFQRKALPDPEAELSFGGFGAKSESPQGELDSYTIMQPLGSLGERLSSFSVANSENALAQNHVQTTWAEIRTRLITLYTRIIVEEKATELSRDNLNAARHLYVNVENRYHSGQAGQNELTRARIEVLQAENDMLTHEKEVRSKKGELNLVLGRAPETACVLSDLLDEETLQYQYEGLVEKALKIRPDLKAEHAKVDITKKHLGVAYSKAVLPEMAVGFERTMEDYENDASIVVEFSYPLWGYWGDLKEAEGEYGKQKAELAALRQNAHLNIYQSFLEAELAERQVTLQKNALDEANELLRQTSLLYESGEMPFITYLDNLRTIKETRLNYLMAIAHYKEKIAGLDMTVGQVPLPKGVKK